MGGASPFLMRLYYARLACSISFDKSETKDFCCCHGMLVCAIRVANDGGPGFVGRSAILKSEDVIDPSMGGGSSSTSKAVLADGRGYPMGGEF